MFCLLAALTAAWMLLLQPEAVKAVITSVLSQPLEHVGDALAGFKWEFEKVRGGWGMQPKLGCWQQSRACLTREPSAAHLSPACRIQQPVPAWHWAGFMATRQLQSTAHAAAVSAPAPYPAYFLYPSYPALLQYCAPKGHCACQSPSRSTAAVQCSHCCFAACLHIAAFTCCCCRCHRVMCTTGWPCWTTLTPTLRSS